MTESYSISLIQFTLTHYLDIEAGHLVTEQMPEFTSSGKSNPRETAYIWYSDVKEAVNKLCRKYDRNYWPEICQDLGREGARFSVEKLSPIQRYVVKNCIFGDCGSVCQKLATERRQPCIEIWAICRMQRILNGDPKPENVKSLPEAAQARKKWRSKKNLKQYNIVRR